MRTCRPACRCAMKSPKSSTSWQTGCRPIESSIRETSDPAPFSYLLARRQYLPVLHMRKNEVQSHLHEAESVVDTMRVKLFEQARETSTLEKLKQRQFEEYRKEAQQQEQKVIDELAVAGHFRKNLNKV